ncbi:hypothetical protein TGPRC2_246140 [Toxoplasma gondii TgCatPRC2]|uniref:Alpha-ketoglutarate-dependent dioxygenase ABH4 n=1 Tax=Toxoplasma gondii TgCatPRC2 TaxID=1130821 RepID=A0A151HGC3_TOXGO|nr:hypothetical protein TGPRC2_246140 [Toxoplasma gondii TgCatPRC2]
MALHNSQGAQQRPPTQQRIDPAHPCLYAASSSSSPSPSFSSSSSVSSFCSPHHSSPSESSVAPRCGCKGIRRCLLCSPSSPSAPGFSAGASSFFPRGEAESLVGKARDSEAALLVGDASGDPALLSVSRVFFSSPSLHTEGEREPPHSPPAVTVPDARHRADRPPPPFSRCRCTCSGTPGGSLQGESLLSSIDAAESKLPASTRTQGDVDGRRDLESSERRRVTELAEAEQRGERSQTGERERKREAKASQAGEAKPFRAAHSTEVKKTDQSRLHSERDYLSLYLLWCPQCRELHRQVREPEELDVLEEEERGDEEKKSGDKRETEKSGERREEAKEDAAATDEFRRLGGEEARGEEGREAPQAETCCFLRTGVCERIEEPNGNRRHSQEFSNGEAFARKDRQASSAASLSHPILTTKDIARAVARLLQVRAPTEGAWAAAGSCEGERKARRGEGRRSDGDSKTPREDARVGDREEGDRGETGGEAETEESSPHRGRGWRDEVELQALEPATTRRDRALRAPVPPVSEGKPGLSSDLEEALLPLLGLSEAHSDTEACEEGGEKREAEVVMRKRDSSQFAMRRRDGLVESPFGVYLLPDALERQEEAAILAWADGNMETGAQSREATHKPQPRGDTREYGGDAETEPRAGLWVLSQSGRRKIDFGPQVNFKKKRLKPGRFNGFPPFAKALLSQPENASSAPPSCSDSFLPSPADPSSPTVSSPPSVSSSSGVSSSPDAFSPRVACITESPRGAASDVRTSGGTGKRGVDRLTPPAFRAELLANFQPVELCLLEYVPDRGSHIEEHFDDFWLWGPRLVTFNLASSTILSFVSPVFCVSRELFEVARAQRLFRSHQSPLSPSPVFSSEAPETPPLSPASSCSPSLSSKAVSSSAVASSSGSSSASCSSAAPSDSCSLPSPGLASGEFGRVRVEIRVLLPRRSLVVFEGHCRYTWTHAVRSHHIFSRRVAVTLRELAPEFLPGGENEEVGQKLLSLSAFFNGSPVNAREEARNAEELASRKTDTEETAWKRPPLVSA